MSYHTSYIQYLVEYHVKRDWFECHEIMEECWKEEQDVELKPTWLMLVKLAVAQYHERRGNYRGAAKLYRGVFELWPLVKWDILSIDTAHLRHEVEHHLSIVEEQMQAGNTVLFEPINMCIVGQELIRACEEYCHHLDETWQVSNTPADNDLIHRHRLRDRTEVINARDQALASKRRNV